MHTLDIAPLRSESPPQKRSGMARVLKGFHSICSYEKKLKSPCCSGGKSVNNCISAIGVSDQWICSIRGHSRRFPPLKGPYIFLRGDWGPLGVALGTMTTPWLCLCMRYYCMTNDRATC